MSGHAFKGWAAISTPPNAGERVDPYTVRHTKAAAMLAFSTLYGVEFAAGMIKDKRVRFGRIVTEIAS